MACIRPSTGGCDALGRQMAGQNVGGGAISYDPVERLCNDGRGIMMALLVGAGVLRLMLFLTDRCMAAASTQAAQNECDPGAGGMFAGTIAGLPWPLPSRRWEGGFGTEFEMRLLP